jgi:hypothetical protein
LTPEQLRGRAQKAARTRWHGVAAENTPEIDELERAQFERRVDELVAAAPPPAAWSPEVAAKLRRLFNPPEPVR